MTQEELEAVVLEEGGYRREPVKVDKDGCQQDAFAFVAVKASRKDKKPKAQYFDYIVQGARELELPASYTQAHGID